ncbi:hypothetical protein NEF87_002929 [Candidatus Lokiarchaeum ossiferum]|uniref:Histidine kinase N-terminal 7TM region domain-containing protein n=1 Tax=Candidatus Lokiarchaeum ossiferum TaxID=2951803 RepID=A0ABY6HT12_9ARCH|nr:hypothetical protein NEF87_002929 [Candidatus Lokiarchaeum sp. B-35]
MDVINILKIVGASSTLVVAALCGVIELKKNSKSWINRFFAMFYIALASGFFLYTIYHFIFNHEAFVIPIMITGHIFFNFGFICLLVSALMISASQRTILNKKYLIPISILYIISFIGYFIWIPVLDMEDYAQGIVNTETPDAWFLFVNLYRVLILIFVIIRFSLLISRATGVFLKQLRFFTIGITLILIALFVNAFGGSIDSIELLLEVLMFVFMDAGMIISLRGFTIHTDLGDSQAPEIAV